MSSLFSGISMVGPGMPSMTHFLLSLSAARCVGAYSGPTSPGPSLKNQLHSMLCVLVATPPHSLSGQPRMLSSSEGPTHWQASEHARGSPTAAVVRVFQAVTKNYAAGVFATLTSILG